MIHLDNLGGVSFEEEAFLSGDAGGNGVLLGVGGFTLGQGFFGGLEGRGRHALPGREMPLRGWGHHRPEEIAHLPGRCQASSACWTVSVSTSSWGDLTRCRARAQQRCAGS